MASVSIKTSVQAITPLEASKSYNTGGSEGRPAGGMTYAYLDSRINEHLDGKVDTDLGTSGRFTLSSDITAVTPLEASKSYNTGGSEGRPAGGITYAIALSYAVKVLTPSALGGGPAATTPTSVTFNFNVNSDVTVGDSAFGDARVTQAGMEVAIAADGGEARVTQAAMEIAMEAGTSNARVTQAALELAIFGEAGDARVTQAGMEVAMRDDRPELFNSIPRLAPTDGAAGVPLVPILELYLDNSVVRRFSQVGVIIGTQPYEPGVLSFGSINREIDPQGRDYRISEMQVEMDNSTGTWSALKAGGLTGRTVRVKLARPDLPLTSASIIYTGVIDGGWTLTRTSFIFTMIDVFAGVLDVPLLIPVTNFSFPFIPEGEPAGGMVPIVIGDHLDADGRRKGQLPAYLIDPAFTDPVLGSGSFRYVACQGDIEETTKVYVNGVEQTEGVDYTLAAETGSGLFFTADTVNYITFATDPRDTTANPPNEDATNGFNVTWSGKGLIDPDTGATYDNPAEQLFEFMKKHTADFRNGDPFIVGIDRTELGLNDADFDQATVTSAKLFFEQLGVSTSFALTDIESTLQDILDNFASSTGLLTTSSVEGKIRFTVRTEEALSPGFVEHLVEGTHIAEESVEHTSVDEILGSIGYNYDRDFVLERFYKYQSRVSADGNSQNLGATGTLDMLYVREPTVAAIITQSLLFFSEEARILSFMQVDPHLHDDIDVGDVIALTEAAGPTSDGQGFRARFMRVTSIGFDFSSIGATAMNIRGVDILAFGTNGDGQDYFAFADTFVTALDPIGVEQEDLWSTADPVRTC